MKPIPGAPASVSPGERAALRENPANTLLPAPKSELTKEAESPAAVRDPLRELRWLIWLYFFLLLFEGALRKWIVPGLTNPLLIIRDPVLLLIYLIAYNRRLFPANGFTLGAIFLAIVSFLASFLAQFGDWRVALFGVHCNFLHLPLIFVIGRVFKFEDVRRVGWWILLISLPMAALMALQFQSSGDTWINRGAGEDAKMLDSINGRIRPSGTFSFVSGIIFFYAAVMAYLIYGLVQKRVYPWWLTLSAGVALPLALAVSSSRSTVAGCAIVLMAFVFAIVCRPSLALKASKLFIIAFAVASCVGGMALFKEGMETFTARVEHASDVEGGSHGFVDRFVEQFTHPFAFVLTMPIVGYGLGSGTNVGAKLLTGEIEFMLAEEEWERVMLESGPILGFAFILWRICLVVWLAWLAWRAARAAHFLPLLLLGACGVGIVNGQFGQSTTLGFVVFVAGLTLASMRVPQLAPIHKRMPQSRGGLVPAKVRATWAAVQARKDAARRRPGPPSAQHV